MRYGVWGIIFVALAGSAGTPAFGADAEALVAVQRVPDGGLQPQVAVDARGQVHLLYFKGEAGGGDVFYVHRAEGGAWSKPLRANQQAGSVLAIGTIRGAQLALGTGGRPHVAWMGSAAAQPRGPEGQAPMLYSRLNDAGDAFEPQRNLMQFATGLDGGGTLAADPTGRVWVAWHANAGAKGESQRRVFVAASRDEGRTFAREAAALRADTGACGCCGMRAGAGPEGHLAMLYRAAGAEVNRDMILLWSQDHGETFTHTVLDRWQINTCPMSTAALAWTPEAALAAWETKGQVFYSRIDLATGKPSAAVAAPGPGSGRKHPAVAQDAQGRILLAWTEGTGWNRGGAAAWQVFDATGARLANQGGRADGVPVWGLVAVYARPNGGFVLLD